MLADKLICLNLSCADYLSQLRLCISKDSLLIADITLICHNLLLFLGNQRIDRLLLLFQARLCGV